MRRRKRKRNQRPRGQTERNGHRAVERADGGRSKPISTLGPTVRLSADGAFAPSRSRDHADVGSPVGVRPTLQARPRRQTSATRERRRSHAFRRRETRCPHGSTAPRSQVLAARRELLAHRDRDAARVPRRRRRISSGRCARRSRAPALVLHPRLGHQQPDEARAGRRRRRAAGSARTVPQRDRGAPQGHARLRARVGLRDALRARARVVVDPALPAAVRSLPFRLDDRHPLGASHHQKVIVVDDDVAFVSGFDLAPSRWDTSEHACRASVARERHRRPTAPFHDVGAMVEGPCAARAGGAVPRALAARDRTRRARRRRAPPRKSRGRARSQPTSTRRRRRDRAHRAPVRQPPRRRRSCGTCISTPSPAHDGSSSPRTSTSRRPSSPTRWPSGCRRPTRPSSRS